MSLLFDLKGRTALITGAGQGMGAGIVEALAKQGACVYINDLYEDRVNAQVKIMRAKGYDIKPAHGDITDNNFIKHIVEHCDGIDILINNAGVPVGMPNALRPFEEMTAEDYARQFSLNFYAVVNLVQAVLPNMIKQGHGRILMISSESWRLGQSFGLSDYASSKAATIGFMRTLSAETGKKGVTVNALSLGAMNNHGYDEIAAKVTAVGRAGTPEDVGAAATYLVSDEASWMTGQTIALNGGSCTA